MSIRITEADVRRFTEGDCHYLARAINKLTGWPIHCFLWGDNQPDTHAFIVMSNGKFLDIEGVHEPEDFFESWGEHHHKEFDFATIRSYFLTPVFGDYTYRRAKQVAELIVTQTKGTI